MRVTIHVSSNRLFYICPSIQMVIWLFWLKIMYDMRNCIKVLQKHYIKIVFSLNYKFDLSIRKKLSVLSFGCFDMFLRQRRKRSEVNLYSEVWAKECVCIINFIRVYKNIYYVYSVPILFKVLRSFSRSICKFFIYYL